MATAAVIGLSAGKRLFSSTFHYSDLTEKLSYINDHPQLVSSSNNVIIAKKSSDYSRNLPSNQRAQSIKAVKDTTSAPSTVESWFEISDESEEENSDSKFSVEAFLLLQKSLLEKQWTLPFEPNKKHHKNVRVTSSGISARQRRTTSRKRISSQNFSMEKIRARKRLVSIVSPDLLQNRSKGYVKGVVSEQLLSHAEVVRLSKKIKVGLSLEERKSR